MNVVGYVRVSTNEQAEKGVSLGAQEERIRAWCQAREWDCVEIFRDDGYSAKDLKRPALRRLLEEVSRQFRRFDGVVVAKLDRLTRSVRDLGTLTETAEKHGLALVSVQESVDTTTATGKLFHTLVAAISEWERGMVGERTRDALAHKRQRGERTGALPYGYALAPDGRRLVPMASELAVLRQIRAERARGKSLALIADDLNNECVPTKHRGRRWYPATIRSVLATAKRYEHIQTAAPPRRRAGRVVYGSYTIARP